MTDQPLSCQELVVATLMRPEGDTGVQTHFNTALHFFRQQGLEPRLVTPYGAPTALVYPVFAVRKLIDPLQGTASVWWYQYWHELFLRWALRRQLTSEPTVIYAQCPPSARAALRARRHPNHRVVLVVHFNVSQAEEWVSKGKFATDSVLYRAIRRQEQQILPRLDGIVFLSEYVRRAVLATMPAVANVPALSVPNFIPAPPLAATDGPQADLINIGTLEPRKNQAYLLRVLAAAQQLGHRYTLTLVGDGPDRAKLQRLAAELGIASQVTFVGRQLQAARFLPAHRAYAHSATIENMPIALIEALAAARPILAAPVGGVSEVFRDGIEGRYWDLQDPEGGARQLTKVLEDQSTYARMCAAARGRFEREFAEELVGKRLLSFLQQIGGQELSNGV